MCYLCHLYKDPEFLLSYAENKQVISVIKSLLKKRNTQHYPKYTAAFGSYSLGSELLSWVISDAKAFVFHMILSVGGELWHLRCGFCFETATFKM